MEPPDTIPNSEVKRCNADGSVGHPHVRVGHRQVTKYESKLNKIKTEEPQLKDWGFCFLEFIHYLKKRIKVENRALCSETKFFIFCIAYNIVLINIPIYIIYSFDFFIFFK